MRLFDLGLFILAKRKLGKSRITSPKYITRRVHTKGEEAWLKSEDKDSDIGSPGFRN